MGSGMISEWVLEQVSKLALEQAMKWEDEWKDEKIYSSFSNKRWVSQMPVY